MGSSAVGKRSWTALCVGVLLLFASGFAHALGLGQATVNSYLNEPLNARIDLISRSEAEMATVTAGMASAADFQVVGLTRDILGMPIEFTISRDLSDPHIRLTSSQVVTEPVLQLVVEVVWSSGRMLRQYTLFFDPPSFDAPAPLPATPSSARRTPSVPVPDQTPVPAANVPAPAASVPEPESSDPAAPVADSAIAETSAVTDTGPPFEPVETQPEAEPEVDADTEVATGVDEIANQTPAENDVIAETVAEGAQLEETPLAEALVGEGPAVAVPEDDEPVNQASATEGLSDDELALNTVDNDGRLDSVTDEARAVVGDAQEVPAVTEPEPGQVVEAEALAEQQKDLAANVNQEPDAVAEPAIKQDSTDVVVDESVESEPAYRSVIPQASVAGTGSLSDQINVQRGDTLWDLSQDIAAERGVTVNQVMLAVQQSNPQAFLDNNINRMMAGEVLRIPKREDMLSRNTRDAMLEVMRQEALYRTRWDIPTDPNDIPTISDLAQEASPEAVNPEATPDDSTTTASATTQAEEVSLVLVPPSERDDSMDEGMGQGTGGNNEASEGISVVEELARTQEELANAQQENNYLNERISELESALDQERAEAEQGVADSNLADMEERLREDRMAPEPEIEAEVDAQEAPASLMSRFGLLIGAVLLLLIAGMVFFLRSQRNREYIDSGTSSGNVADSSPDGDAATQPMSGMIAQPEADTEAVEMDLADPEARLDLARAYAAMGREDKARELLESVVQDGDASQEREAREMLREL